MSPRRLITHHGLYVGGGQVIHYAGLADGLQAGPVILSPLEAFLGGRPCFVNPYRTRRFSRARSVERARARLGEDLYNLAFNNCEHFVTWCITGRHRSRQADLVFGVVSGVLGLAISRYGRGVVARLGGRLARRIVGL